ncbi:MAG: hypothetical protein Hens3KO_04020 [Henriciella sp.]
MRYVVAIALIAGLLTTTHVAATKALEASARNAVLVNTSGRQRMLSQRILFLSEQAVYGRSEKAKAQLNDAVNLFSSSQLKLAKDTRLSAELIDLYEGEGQLNQRVHEFSMLAKAVEERSGDSESDPHSALQELLAYDRELLLHDLDLSVKGFEDIAKRDSARLDALQGWSLFAAIIVLLLEGLFIFLPAQLTVTSSINRLEQQKQALKKAKINAIERNQRLEALKAKVEHEALHDALTGLPNRRALEQAMAKLKKETQNTSNTISVMHIDLDRFKLINDTLGHAAGDHVLRHVASTLKSNLPETDMVARVGGDEFVVLPELNSDPETLSERAERIIEAMRKPIPFKDSVCHFGASIGIGIGISSGKTEYVDPSDLLVKADIALYRAKELGRGRFEFFSDDLAIEVEMAKRMSDELIFAFERNEFTVHYQPIFCTRTGTIVAVEALARWNHPNLGLQTAGSFVDQLDDMGLTSELDKVIIRLVAEDIEQAKKAGTPFPRVAINVSAKSLLRNGFVEQIRELNMPLDAISLELSESIDFDNNVEAIMKQLSVLRGLGVDIEIDDFGTGHASIFSFHKIRPTRVKIARELISDAEHSQETREMIGVICKLAKAYGAETIAEGIESEALATIVAVLGCDLLQGFGLSLPKERAKVLVEIANETRQIERQSEAADTAVHPKLLSVNE